MKKLLFFGLFALVSLLSPAQNLVAKDASNAFLVFQRGDGIDTYYKINSVKVFIDEATIGRTIEANSGIELVGFARTQKISANIFDFVSKPVVSAPVVIPKPDYVITSGQVQLNIPGYSEVTEIILADASLKIKDANRLDVQIATHSISLGENLGLKRSMVTYKITDQNGKTWVQVIQKQPTIEGRLGGAYGNNHPDKQYISGLSEDCNIFLPLGNSYTIEIDNAGELTIDFWVHFPWSQDGQERRLHREDIAPEGVRRRYYTIDTNQLGLSAMPDFKRTIKINCNGHI